MYTLLRAASVPSLGIGFQRLGFIASSVLVAVTLSAMPAPRAVEGSPLRSAGVAGLYSPSSITWISVTPDGGSASAPGHKSGNYVDFEAEVISGNSLVYDVTCSVSGAVLACTPEEDQVILPIGFPTTVRVFYQTGAPGTGQVTVRLTESGCTKWCAGDTGYYDVNVGDPLPPTFSNQSNVRLLIPEASFAAGSEPAARFRPHELVLRHLFPGYWTLDTERAVTLVYSSQTGTGRLVIPFNLKLNADPPDDLTARLEVSGVQQGNTIYFSTTNWPDGESRRLALLFDASGFATGSYAYGIVVTSVYGSDAYEAVQTGRVAVLNETVSPFGRGWRVAGIQRLYSNGDTITVVGSDRGDEAHAWSVFFPNGSGGYTGPEGEFSTISAITGGGWKRTMSDGTVHYFGSGGLQDSTVDRNGNVTSYSYDGSSRLTSITDPVGDTTSFSYSTSQVSVSIPGSRTATLGISSGRLTQITDPDGKSVSFGYDGNQRLTSRTSKRGHTTSYSYDYGWMPSGASLPISASRSHVSPRRAGLANYPSEGTSSNPKAVAEPDSAIGTYTDARGKVWIFRVECPSLARTYWKDPLENETTWERQPDGQPTKRVLPNGRDTRYSYDARGNLTQVEEISNGAKWRYAYESTYNNLVQMVTPLADTFEINYDDHGNPNELIVPEDSVWKMTYNSRGQPVEIVHLVLTAGGKAFVTADSLFYDESGTRNLIRRRRQNGPGADWDTVGYSYDAAGRTTEVRDQRGGAVQFAYDAMNRVTSRTDQLSRAESWTYNAAGLDSVWTNRRSQTVKYAYDALDRLVEKVANDTTVFQYDAEDHLTRAYDGDSDVYFYPDALGRDTATVQNGKRIGYTYYDGMWDQKTLRDPDGGVHTFTYDTLSRLTQIKDPENAVTTFAYDTMDRRTSMTQANGVETSYSYDGSSHVTQIAAMYGTTTYASFDYSYDPQGNRSGWTYENGDFYTFTHDYQGQLKSAKLQQEDSTVLYSSSFSYDGANNRTAGGDYSGYTYNAANRLTSTDSSSYSYDNDGNLTSETDRGTSYTYSYDREGRLTGQTGPSLTVSFKYDALGRRIEQSVNGTVTKFLYDDDHVLADLNNSGTTIARYTHGPEVDQIVSARRGGTNYYYIQDALGSVVRILDGSRNLKNSYDYLAWGEIRSETEGIDNRYTYTGRELTPDGHTMYYRARTYWLGLGRFGQEDAAGLFLSDANLYRYVRNAPCNLTDPSGHFPCGRELLEVGLVYAGGKAAMKVGRWAAGRLKSLGRIAYLSGKTDEGLHASKAATKAEKGFLGGWKSWVSVVPVVGAFFAGYDLGSCIAEVLEWD
jgi:RHS repeat-associated protein